MKNSLIELLECHDRDNDEHLHANEFDLLMRNPEMHYALTRFGVNSADLLNIKGVLFKRKEPIFDIGSDEDEAVSVITVPEPSLSFAEFLEVVLRLRGSNQAAVMDIVELRELITQRFERHENLQGEADTPAAFSLRSNKTPLSVHWSPQSSILPRLTQAALKAHSNSFGNDLDLQIAEQVSKKLFELSKGQHLLIEEQKKVQSELSRTHDQLSSEVRKIGQLISEIQLAVEEDCCVVPV